MGWRERLDRYKDEKNGRLKRDDGVNPAAIELARRIAAARPIPEPEPEPEPEPKPYYGLSCVDCGEPIRRGNRCEVCDRIANEEGKWERVVESSRCRNVRSTRGLS